MTGDTPMRRMRWAIGYSNEARAHRLEEPQLPGPDALRAPALCHAGLPFGWLMLFEGQPDPREFPACRLCLEARIRRRSRNVGGVCEAG